MAMEIYWGSGSPYSWRALLALEAKKIPYESRLLEFSKRQHKAPEFLKLNPRGKVPALRDGDEVVCESIAIMAYLDRKHPEPPLFGRNASETAAVWRAISECIYYFEPPTNEVVQPLFFGGAEWKAQEIREAAEKVRQELAGWERRAAATGWLAGKSVTAADLAVFPYVMLLLRAASKDAAKPLELGFLPLGDRYPALDSWRRRVEALPGYERTYPPHWREAPARQARSP